MSQHAQFLPSFFSPVLCLPLNADAKGIQGKGETRDDVDHAPDAQLDPMRFDTSDGSMILAFSSALAMAEFFELPQNYTEIAPQAVLSIAKEKGVHIGFDLGQSHGVLLDAPVVEELLEFIRNRERVRDVEHFDFEDFDISKQALESFETVLPKGQDAWFLQDREEGLILLLLIEGDEFDMNLQAELRRALLSLEVTASASLLALSPNHQKWKAMRSYIERFGIKIVPRQIEPEKKPPILR